MKITFLIWFACTWLNLIFAGIGTHAYARWPFESELTQSSDGRIIDANVSLNSKLPMPPTDFSLPDPTYDRNVPQIYNIWGLERSGTNLMTWSIKKNLKQLDCGFHICIKPLYLHDMLIRNELVEKTRITGPMCANWKQPGFCRKAPRQVQQPIWKHFWVHRRRFSPSDNKHNLSMEPEHYYANLTSVEDFSNLIKNWTGYPFEMDQFLPPVTDIRHIVMVKNPIAWLNSIANTARGKRYIRTEFPLDQRPYTPRRLMKLWIDYYYTWYSWKQIQAKNRQSARILMVPYETLLSHFNEVMTQVFHFLRIPIPSAGFLRPENEGDRIPQSPKDSWDSAIAKYVSNVSVVSNNGIIASNPILVQLQDGIESSVNDALQVLEGIEADRALELCQAAGFTETWLS